MRPLTSTSPPPPTPTPPWFASRLPESESESEPAPSRASYPPPQSAPPPPPADSSSSSSPDEMSAVVSRARAWVSQWWREREPRTRKIILGLGSAYLVLCIIVLLIGPNRIFKLVARAAVWLATQPFGIPLSLAVIMLCSIPPIPGYGLAVTLCGLSFGSRAAGPDYSVWKGWLVAATGCVLGSSVAFGLARFVLRYFATHRRVQDLKDHRNWRAMEVAIQQRGVGIVILLRLAPFPFCYSNLFFASMHSVSYPAFLLATLCITPKLLLHVFVGSRAFELLNSDGETLPLHIRILNWVYIAVGALIGWATGHYLWNTTQRILAEFEEREELEAGRGDGGNPARSDEDGRSGRRVRIGQTDTAGANGHAHANGADGGYSYHGRRDGHATGGGGERDPDPLSGERSPLLGTSPST
ncbi:Tlg2-vesicle protein [Tilletia horrida]|uniref:Golgi apparatus membrane protein TVP38 n=1 Tax=Tilletia horrida TaxID=155126 RepID=A0AAN6G5S7_9BASI|nr:Tlg2-vesicle protein [Tilletia horrida]KAK0528066.1 Tlg2-vesicle protein [Tilletia horrida]KAK0547955.1 Tlg2-vesicle protein [Tilletia horrida]